MKIALVHDYLNQLGGGERVLDELIRTFPDADVYTLMYDKEKTLGCYEHVSSVIASSADFGGRSNPGSRITGTSFLDFQFARDHHRLFIPLMPLAARAIDLGNKYDLIISDTAGFAKGISYDRSKTKHISYIHTPLRYAWETENYFDNSPRNLILKILAAPLFAFVRHWDYWAGQRPDVLLANSKYIAGKVKQYYGRDAEVVYPPVDSSKFYFEFIPPLQKGEGLKGGGFKSLTARLALAPARQASGPLPFEKGEYYLAAGRLLHYKRFDLIIDAFAQLKLPLKIVGAGPEFESLSLRARQQSGAAIQFLGYVGDAELRTLYQNAKAFIMANDEDFGLVMAEAQACGTPIIAYAAGGSLEIINDPSVIASTRSNPGITDQTGSPRGYTRDDREDDSITTGIFFDHQTPESLVEALQRFEKMQFDRKTISESAHRFSVENFQKEISAVVSRVMAK